MEAKVEDKCGHASDSSAWRGADVHVRVGGCVIVWSLIQLGACVAVRACDSYNSRACKAAVVRFGFSRGGMLSTKGVGDAVHNNEH